MFRTARYAIAALALLVIGITGGSAASTASVPTKQQIAQRILASRAVLSSPARSFLESVARNDHRIAPDSVGISVGGATKTQPSLAPAVAAPALVNARVNNPANDSHQTDQTTQSETSVAVSGLNVAVGYNNSQHALLFLTAGGDLTGYGYSTNGGATFTDGGALPNAPGDVNVGDPWLASDSSGAMYFLDADPGCRSIQPPRRGIPFDQWRQDLDRGQAHSSANHMRRQGVVGRPSTQRTRTR